MNEKIIVDGLDECPLCHEQVNSELIPPQNFSFKHEPCGFFELTDTQLDYLQNPKDSNNYTDGIETLKAEILKANMADDSMPCKFDTVQWANIFRIDLG